MAVAPVPSPVATDAVAACRALIAALPDQVDGHRRRPATGDPERVAAWGDPPIVLRCASGPLVTPTGATQTYGVQGVRWVTSETGDTIVWTSFGRVVTVELRVPAEYEGARIVTPLSEVIAATVPARG